MSPTEVKKLEDRLSRLEKLVALLLQEDDWLDNPKVASIVRQKIAQSERDIKAGRFENAEDVFQDLGV